MKFSAVAFLSIASALAVTSGEVQQETTDSELTFYGEDAEVDFRFLKAKATKAPAIKSTKAPVMKSTKAPAIKSTKAPAMKSTKAPTIKSRRELV